MPRSGVNLNTHVQTTVDGAAHYGDAITAAALGARGTVRQAATVAAPAAATATAAAGANPTKAEFDALLADVDALRTIVADLRTNLRAAGIVA